MPREPDLHRRLIGLWLAASLVWCGFIGALAYSEWRAYQRAAHNLDLTLALKAQLPERCVLDGEVVLRICANNFTTTEADVAIVVDRLLGPLPGQ